MILYADETADKIKSIMDRRIETLEEWDCETVYHARIMLNNLREELLNITKEK